MCSAIRLISPVLCFAGSLRVFVAAEPRSMATARIEGSMASALKLSFLSFSTMILPA